MNIKSELYQAATLQKSICRNQMQREISRYFEIQNPTREQEAEHVEILVDLKQRIDKAEAVLNAQRLSA